MRVTHALIVYEAGTAAMKITKNTFCAFLVPIITVTMAGNLASCGTILYPERNGQRAGQIDPLVAVLDGVGLLFFLIPGVIAFAVDFNNHSIYLPHGHARRAGSSHEYSRTRITAKLDRAVIENFVRTETGTPINLRQPNMRVIRLDSVADLDARFETYNQNVRVASAR
jgi:hypothetical protein